MSLPGSHGSAMALNASGSSESSQKGLSWNACDIASSALAASSTSYPKVLVTLIATRYLPIG